MARLIRNRESRRGVAAVETMFALPLFMVVTFGVIELGSLFFVRHNMMHAARSAARAVAVQEGTFADAEQVAFESLPNMNMNFDVDISEEGDDVIVEISVPMSEAALGDIFGIYGEGDLGVRVTMRREE